MLIISLESDEIKGKLLFIPSQFKQPLIKNAFLIYNIYFTSKICIKYSTLHTDTKRAKPTYNYRAILS